ncbi:hypothetical protein ZIOFF_016925 [Zingiber officinale]|uniref:Chlororespiratory reduction 4 n=1 Tax=Zingiber officinale TaxID=94328 RepID=A0A8J5HB35_ZINOF|nr:hypothetical protein ZIOFF_016925 [Zingiber officinale]
MNGDWSMSVAAVCPLLLPSCMSALRLWRHIHVPSSALFGRRSLSCLAHSSPLCPASGNRLQAIPHKDVNEAEELFERMPEKNCISWNTMLAFYAEKGQLDEAFHLFTSMQDRKVVSWNTIMIAMAQSGRLDEAYRLFDQMPERDVISWTSMIAALSHNLIECRREMWFLECHDIRAPGLFEEMKEKNVVTWTAMITGCIEDQQNEMALKMSLEMLMAGVKPNQATFANVLAAASNLAAFAEGQQIHQIVSKTISQFDPSVNSALMIVYSKCGEIAIARKLFELPGQKDLVCWNGMIAAYAHHGNGQEALNLFKNMHLHGFKPNDVTYVGLLSACSHSSLFDEGLNLFKCVMNDPSIQVREDHYASLVDLCGRAGRLKEASSFIKGPNISPSSPPVWGALLGGCNVHGDIKIGNLATKMLMEAEPNNTGSYMLLSNIYASKGRWNAIKIRLRMKDKGLRKQPGCSWIEVRNRVHVCMVRDKSHSESEKINALLHDLHNKMQKRGYVNALDLISVEDEVSYSSF